MATGEQSRSQPQPYLNLTLSVQPSLFDLYYEDFLSEVMPNEESSKSSKVILLFKYIATGSPRKHETFFYY